VVLACLLVASVAAIKYKTQTIDLPAYHTPGNGGISSRGERLPLPHFNHRIGIKYWGGWEVVDTATGEPIPTGGVFFHHITVFRSHANGEREFLTGCSDDRRTLGPDLDHPYLQLVDSSPNDEGIQGYYHVVNLLPRAVKMAVRYNVTYVADDDIPANTVWVKAHFLSTAYNVPGNGGKDSVHAQVTDTTAPASGRVVTAVGHLHQGAFNVTLFQKKGMQELVSSKAIYASPAEKDHCFYNEWCAQSGHPWKVDRVKDIQLVKGLNIPIRKGTPWEMISYYDNAAEYRTVMAWVVLFVDESADS